MKRDFLNLPFFLLFNFIVYYAVFSHANFPDMGILCGLIILYGYKLYLNTRIVEKLPIPIEKRELLDQIDQLRLNKEITALQLDMVRLAEGKKGIENGRGKKVIF